MRAGVELTLRVRDVARIPLEGIEAVVAAEGALVRSAGEGAEDDGIAAAPDAELDDMARHGTNLLVEADESADVADLLRGNQLVRPVDAAVVEECALDQIAQQASKTAHRCSLVLFSASSIREGQP